MPFTRGATMSRRPFLLFAILLSFILPAAAAQGAQEIPLPAALSPALDHLIAQAGPGAPPFDPARVEKLIDFVLGAKEGPLYYESRERDKKTSASHAFTLRADLGRLLRYGYNSAIPGHLLNPSSVRRVRWTEVDGRRQGLPRLWERLPRLDRPVIVRGTEREEIAPNLATGTYFEYDLDRTLILLPHRSGPVLITVSRQKGRSQVGKKGAVLGADSNWDYLYSGEKGIPRTGLGWVDSYMYASTSVAVFAQTGERQIKGGNFKWLNAGWSGINMVKRSHIHDGLVRYARDLQGILEHPRLPSAEELAASAACLSRMPAPELQSAYRRHADRLAQRYGRDRSLHSDFSKLLRSGEYAARASREEMEATLALEVMKCFLTKSCADPQLFAACRK